MAQLLQITDGTTTVDFYDGNIKLAADGWKTTTSREKVWETLELVGDATDANIRTTKDQIDGLAEQARQYHLNAMVADAVWFQWNADSESAKQSLVYEIESEILAHEPLSSPLLGKNVILMRVVIQRHPDYETTSATNTTSSNVSCDGGTWTIGNAVGTSPERISDMEFDTDAAGTHQQIWCGIRPLYEGVGSFVAKWEAEEGTSPTGTTVVDPDATASGSKSLSCDLTVTGLDGQRTTIEISDIVGSNYNHFIGTYHILARMKVASSATQVLIELKQYWKGSYSSAGLTVVDGQTAWTLFSLGTVSFPPTGDRGNIASNLTDFQNCGFTIHANSFDDTGTLGIDAYYLIPAEHTLTILGCQVDTTYTLNVYTDPDDQVWGMGLSTYSQGGLQISPHNWYYPVGGGLMVVATQADSGHILSQTIDLSIDLIPRWKTYRDS